MFSRPVDLDGGERVERRAAENGRSQSCSSRPAILATPSGLSRWRTVQPRRRASTARPASGFTATGWPTALEQVGVVAAVGVARSSRPRSMSSASAHASTASRLLVAEEAVPVEVAGVHVAVDLPAWWRSRGRSRGGRRRPSIVAQVRPRGQHEGAARPPCGRRAAAGTKGCTWSTSSSAIFSATAAISSTRPPGLAARLAAGGAHAPRRDSPNSSYAGLEQALSRERRATTRPASLQVALDDRRRRRPQHGAVEVEDGGGGGHGVHGRSVPP